MAKRRAKTWTFRNIWTGGTILDHSDRPPPPPEHQGRLRHRKAPVQTRNGREWCGKCRIASARDFSDSGLKSKRCPRWWEPAGHGGTWQDKCPAMSRRRRTLIWGSVSRRRTLIWGSVSRRLCPFPATSGVARNSYENDKFGPDHAQRRQRQGDEWKNIVTLRFRCPSLMKSGCTGDTGNLLTRCDRVVEINATRRTGLLKSVKIKSARIRSQNRRLGGVSLPTATPRAMESTRLRCQLNFDGFSAS